VTRKPEDLPKRMSLMLPVVGRAPEIRMEGGCRPLALLAKGPFSFKDAILKKRKG